MLGIEAIKITPEMLARACEIDAFKGLWCGLEQHTTGLNMLADIQDHGDNLRQVLSKLKDQELTADMIRALHGVLHKTPGPSPYKTQENMLEIAKGREIAGALETAPPEQAEKLMGKLVEWLNASMGRDDFHPLLSIAVFTAVFLQISPFAEGNMRLARFLAVLLLMKAGYAYAPFITLDRIMEERAASVFRALRHNQESLESGRPDWSLWLICFFMILQEQKNQMQHKLGAKTGELSRLPTLSGKIMGLFEQHERLQMKQIITLTRGRRSTVKLRLGELVDGGYLRRRGQARSTWYSLS